MDKQQSCVKGWRQDMAEVSNSIQCNPPLPWCSGKWEYPCDVRNPGRRYFCQPGDTREQSVSQSIRAEVRSLETCGRRSTPLVGLRILSMDPTARRTDFLRLLCNATTQALAVFYADTHRRSLVLGVGLLAHNVIMKDEDAEPSVAQRRGAPRA